MRKYIFKRLIVTVLTMWVLITVVFFLVRLMPGDPFQNPKMTTEIRKNMEEYYGFDKPLIVQYGNYMKNLFKGDLGYSMKFTNKTVNGIISESFPLLSGSWNPSASICCFLWFSAGNYIGKESRG